MLQNAVKVNIGINIKGKSEIFAAKPVDIWALGVSLFIMIYKVLPFISADNNMFEIINLISAGE